MTTPQVDDGVVTLPPGRFQVIRFVRPFAQPPKVSIRLVDEGRWGVLKRRFIAVTNTAIDRFEIANRSNKRNDILTLAWRAMGEASQRDGDQ